MIIVKCKKGHFFDGEVYGDTCPHCGAKALAEKKNTQSGAKATTKSEVSKGDTPTNLITSEGVMNSDGETCGLWDEHTEKKNVLRPAQPIVSDTRGRDADGYIDIGSEPESEQVHDAEFAESNRTDIKPSLLEVVKESSASSGEKTLGYFVSVAGENTAVKPETVNTEEPVVGWLVCVGGVNFGRCFSIYAGNNSVGRANDNRVVIPNDQTISKSKHAFIVYEPKKRDFYLRPGESSGLTYLNGEPAVSSYKMNANDLIELGNSKFIFVPLCKEDFSWEDYINKEIN